MAQLPLAQSPSRVQPTPGRQSPPAPLVMPLTLKLRLPTVSVIGTLPPVPMALLASVRVLDAVVVGPVAVTRNDPPTPLIALVSLTATA